MEGGGHGDWRTLELGPEPGGVQSRHFDFRATASDEQLREIDNKLDDGNLSTGLFQKIADNPARVSYILEQNP